MPRCRAIMPRVKGWIRGYIDIKEKRAGGLLGSRSRAWQQSGRGEGGRGAWNRGGRREEGLYTRGNTKGDVKLGIRLNGGLCVISYHLRKETC